MFNTRLIAVLPILSVIFLMIPSCNEEDLVSEKDLCGEWYAEYNSTKNPHFIELFSNRTGKWHFGNDYSFDEDLSWSLKGNKLTITKEDGSVYVEGEVRSFESDYKLMVADANGLLNIYFRRLEDCIDKDSGSGGGNMGGDSSSGSVPSSIVGKYIHLYRSDGQKLIVEHLTSNAPNFINNSWISYIPGFEPYYEYEKKSSNSARYYIHWNPLSYSQGSSGVNPKTYVEVTLNFDSSDRTHGTYSGTNWIEGWNWNTNTEYRKNETESKGTFYLGGPTDPNPEYGSDNGGNSGSSDSGKEGTVKTIEISSVSDITSNSAVISGMIDIDGKYDEMGIICTSFDNSVEYYAYSLACAGPNTFKSSYGKYCTTVSLSEFSIKKTGLLSNRNYRVEAYAIIGDKLYRSSPMSFTTK